MSDKLNRVFCLVRADMLDYDVSVRAEQQLHNLMQGKAGKIYTIYLNPLPMLWCPSHLTYVSKLDRAVSQHRGIVAQI